MIHGINNNILYAVSLIETHFVKEGKQTQVRQGTGFFVQKTANCILSPTAMCLTLHVKMLNSIVMN